MDGERVCSWTVVKDGKNVIQQVGSEVHQKFPKLLAQTVEEILQRAGDFHGTLETFGDGTQILTVKSLR
jgi:hypothetical protein